MKYRLVVLTHGADGPRHVHDAVASFRDHVTPQPELAILVHDGDAFRSDDYPEAPARRGWRYATTGGTSGFCQATRLAWQLAIDATGDDDYVFWLEHDFRFLRPVDLAMLAAVLDDSPTLAQMQLMRNAVADHEDAAGGLYQSRPGEYYRRSADGGARWRDPCPRCGEPLCCQPETNDPCCAHPEHGGCGWWPSVWLEHRSYLTTNPSLMRREFMAEHPWPDYPAQCEGLFGLDLVRAGFSFGVWGDGQPWVDHVGVRDGTGIGY